MANGNDTSTGWNWAGFIAIVLGGVALVWTLGRGVSGSFAVLVGYIIGLFAAIVLARMLSGRIDLVQEIDGEPRVVELHPGEAVVNPRNVWHTAVVYEPGDALFVTPGRGTEHRPR